MRCWSPSPQSVSRRGAGPGELGTSECQSSEHRLEAVAKTVDMEGVEKAEPTPKEKELERLRALCLELNVLKFGRLGIVIE